MASSLWGAGQPASFTQNKGQWPAQVAFRARIPGGALFVEHAALTYALHSGGAMAHHGHDQAAAPEPEHAHAFRVSFEGAGRSVPSGSGKLGFYENYFLGNDPAMWGTGCSVFHQVRLADLYPGVDLELDGRNGLKYDLVLAAGADPSVIRMRYTGQSSVQLVDGRLITRTTAGEVMEEAPVAWQETPSGRIPVRCAFHLDGDLVSFHLPDGHDPAFPLVIDPQITFASYSGSSADNFGFTATYDNTGHLYGGGIVFGSGYPITTGVLDPSFNGGNIDIGLTKFSPDGSTLAWSTYIGGSGNETPHSLVVNTNDELYVLAVTSSADFPATTGAFGTSFNGGTTITATGTQGWAGVSGGYGFGHPNGTDIAVARFSADATSLLACTYVGGSGNDGLNNVLPLAHNYGDHFRGEIALDAQEWPVVCTSTQSTDMPVSPNAPQPAFGGGGQDAYVFRMNPALASIQATYFGGNGSDSGYGVQFGADGQVFTTGGTTSTNLSTPGSPWHPGPQGFMDGYVARWTSSLNQLLSATYVGTPEYDQSYFVQLDTDDDVYIVGQTHGSYPVSPGVFANPGSSQFIQKLSHDLSTPLWSTVVGSGDPLQDVSPSAFLVSDCGQIYFSGWGGVVNHYAQASNSTVAGMPVTADAFQAGTDGSDFYLMVLEQDAAALNYATYFGGGQSREHVDGGTSRFDKHGTVYQAVCAGCPGNNDFPTTPNAWSNTNESFNCNLGVFKFDLVQATAHISVDGPDFACLPDATVSFINLSTGGTLYDWDLGDGTTALEFEPTHTYTSPGTYTVRLVLSAEDPCISNDTAYVQVTIIAPQTPSINPVGPVCPGGSVQLQAHGGHLFQWLPAPGINDLNVANPVVQPPASTTYTVVVTDSCGTDTASIEVLVMQPMGVGASNDTVVCTGGSVPLSATGGGTYSWSPASSLDDPTAESPLASPQDTTLYHVLITTPGGCTVEDSLVVLVQYGPPVPLVGDTAMCAGDEVQLLASGGDAYAWLPAPGISDLSIPDPLVAPVEPTTYTVTVSNACGSTGASAFVDVHTVNAAAWPDTLVCPNDRLVLHAAGGTHFQWAPVYAATDSLVLDPAVAGIHTVTVQDDIGCTDQATVMVSLHPPATVSAGYESVIDWGESVPLHAYGSGTFHWEPDSTLSCADCQQPWASPETTTTYTVELTDANGCKATAQVTVYFRGNLFVPNTFTPNGDGTNDVFLPKMHDVAAYRLLVFNRWGELIFSTESQGEGWSGKYKGVDSPVDTYVWRIDYRENHGEGRTAYGHVNLLR